MDEKSSIASPTGHEGTLNVAELVSIPGYPRSRAQSGFLGFLIEDLCTSDLDQLAPWLWLMSTPSYSNITPLHRQRLRGRQIVVMEDPGLHLVWHHRVIYIKPLPKYLLNKDFRDRIIQQAKVNDVEASAISAAALGYLRTYAYLIQHESDFRLAQSEELQLIPKDLDWDSFNSFIAEFEEQDSHRVSPRYQKFGELRFSRLNLLVKVVLLKWHYRYTDGRYKDYLENFYAPLLFLFAVVSVVLNAMQVTLATEQLQNRNWHSFWSASRGFAYFTMVVTAILVAIMVLLLVRKLGVEIVYAIRAQLRSCLGRRSSRAGGHQVA